MDFLWFILCDDYPDRIRDYVSAIRFISKQIRFILRSYKFERINFVKHKQHTAESNTFTQYSTNN